jgi:DNA primase
MEIIDQVRQVSSIVEIASQYTTLRRRGRKHIGLCPFHSEKDPSFTVDEEKQLFHCFGCGVGGDVFSLVMEKENLSFPEALRYLAEKYRIPLPEQQKLNPQVLKLEEKLFKINDLALGHYKKNLFNTKEGAGALEYLRKRKISDETIQKLKIGYAMNSWNALLNFFIDKNVPTSLLEKAGLILPGQKKGDFYDRFRGRIIFPIFSLTGKVVGFGGRTIVDADPKYLNSPDTPLYTKGKLLYGLNFTKEAIREAGEVILVEGYTDFSSLYQEGITNVAASLGTSLTTFQAAQAMRFAGRMIINYDGDAAGRNACARAIPICFEKGLHVQVLVLPENLDPDGFLKKYGKERYLGHKKKTVAGLKFLIDAYSRGVRLDIPEEKSKVARAVVRDIEKIPDQITRSEYLKQASEQLSVDEGILRKIIEHKTQAAPAEEKEIFSPAEKRLLQILIGSKAIAPFVFSEIQDGDFLGLQGEPAFRLICECFKNNQEWTVNELKAKIPPVLFSHVTKALFEKSREASAEEAIDCLFALRKIALQNRLKELQTEIASLERRGEKEKLLALLYKKQDITKQLLAL